MEDVAPSTTRMAMPKSSSKVDTQRGIVIIVKGTSNQNLTVPIRPQIPAKVKCVVFGDLGRGELVAFHVLETPILRKSRSAGPAPAATFSRNPLDLSCGNQNPCAHVDGPDLARPNKSADGKR